MTASGPPPLRVAVVVPALWGGGAEQVATTLAREFARTTEVTLVTMQPRLSRSQLARRSVLPWHDHVPPGCRHVHLPATGRGALRLVRVIAAFAALARRERFDVVYSFLTWTNVMVAVARRLVRTRFVHVAGEHAMAESLLSDGRGLELLSRLLPYVYRLPDRIVVVSDSARESLRAAGVLSRPDRAITIPNPVDSARLRSLAAAEGDGPAHPGGPRHTVVCVGRLHAQKDHATLLRAMTLLPSAFVLRLVGDGPLRESLADSVADLGLTDRVSFTGSLANPYPTMQDADVVVLPSREEGFGLVAVEAAMLEVPFVGSRVGGLADVCALLGHPTFVAGDEQGLAFLIAELVDRPRRGSRDVAEQCFGSAQIAERYLALAPSASSAAVAPGAGAPA